MKLIKHLDINLNTYEHLIFYIKKSEVFDGKKKAFPINGTDQSAYLHVEECQ